MPKILVVDDEPGYPHILSIILEHEGFEVATAESVPEALDVGGRWAPDLLIIDWMLNDIRDGVDVALKLRSQYAAMRTIVITGYPSEELKARIATVPEAQFLAKPFTPEILVSMAWQTAGGSRVRVRPAPGEAATAPLPRSPASPPRTG